MQSGKKLVKFAILSLLLITAGMSQAMAILYEAGNDYNLYGHVYQGDVPVIGAGACCPTSAINSFTYLQNRYPSVYSAQLVSNMPIADVRNLAGPDYMQMPPDGSRGTTDWNIIWGRYKYLEAHAPLQTEYSCQMAMRDGIPLKSANTSAWPLANLPLPYFLQNTPDASGIAVPTWQHIYKNLQQGADLGVAVFGIKNDGEYIGGSHCMTLRSFKFDDRNNDGKIQQGEAGACPTWPGNAPDPSTCPITAWPG